MPTSESPPYRTPHLDAYSVGNGKSRVVMAAALLVMRNTHQGNHAAQHHADRQSNCRYIQRGDDPFEVLLPAV